MNVGYDGYGGYGNSYDFYENMYGGDDDASEEIAKNLESLKRWEAAASIRYNIPFLDSYVDCDDLFELFEWEESKNGYAFWLEVYNELVSNKLEMYPPEVENMV